MACSRGRALPSPHTKLKLFAASGGYCQNPDCNLALFDCIDENDFHIAEMAHVFSASNNGPRADANLSEEERGYFDNLILLCPNCHTIIDKAESSFPDAKIKQWKSTHISRINNLFNIKTFKDRPSVRNAIEPLLLENKTIFDNYGPENEACLDPETNLPKMWKRKILQNIIPNNRKVYQLIEKNYGLLLSDEKTTAAEFKQHIEDFEAKHLSDIMESGARFPDNMNYIYL